MNEENYEYLSKQILKTGFGEGHRDKLKENMQSATPEFSIFHSQDFGRDNTVATLHFRKSDDSERYFFNRFTLLLKNEQHPEPIKQTFNQYYMQDNVTLKEGYNQLSGRAVFREFTPKEGEKYKAWEVLDFKNVDKSGNYETKKYYRLDLERELDKFAVKEMLTDPEKKYLMESLQRGNRQSATVLIAGEEKKVFIEAAPQFKSLNFYDSDMKRINTQSLSQGKEGESQKQEEKKEIKQEQKAGDSDEGAAGNQSEGKGKRRQQGVH